MTRVVVCLLLAAIVVRPWRDVARPLAKRRIAVAPPLAAGGPLWGALVGATAVVAPPLLPVVVLGPTVRAMRARRRRAQHMSAEEIARLPELIDVLTIGISAGRSPRASLELVQDWVPAPFGPATRRTLERCAAGESFAEALATAWAGHGEATLPLIGLLSSSELRGASVLADLHRLGDEARRRRRADLQERVRRLPVAMLVPLVCCVLPAFALIGVAPVVLVTIGDLGFGS
ncbi:MAG: type II secretion system F family protein [Actinomycetota bacterium]